METPENSFCLPLTIVDIDLELETDDPVSGFIGATLRGGFGYALRSLVCITRQQTCLSCIFRSSCAYSFLFETPPPSGTTRMKNYRAVPHPFAIRSRQNGMILEVELVLFGTAFRFLSHFIYTFNKLGAMGIGRKKTKFTVKDAHWNGKLIYPMENDDLLSGINPEMISLFPGEPSQGSVKLTFETPLTIEKDGKDLMHFDSGAFFSTLLRRLTNLNAFYGEEKEMEINPQAYLGSVKELKTEGELKVDRRSRFSTRQEKRIDYSGLVGSVILTGDTGTVMPILEAGEITGVGKNTVFGAGVYRVERLS